MDDEIKKTTPMMEQWHACKRKAKDALLLFRMGDFYEAFYEDAHILAKAADLTLTKRQGIPMSGIPWHTCDSYIEKLVSQGLKIAIAEQMEDPRFAKGIVARDIVRFITPGTLIGSALLQEKFHNYIIAITRVGSLFGVASLDLSTASFGVVELEDETELANELYRLRPAEIAISKKFKEKHPSVLKEWQDIYNAEIEESRFEHQTAVNYLTSHFKVHNLDGFGLKGMVAAINAAGALLSYIQQDLNLPIHHIHEISPYSIADSVSIDKTCAKNLELVESFHEKGRKNTLLSVIDLTETPMGGRLISEWIKKPLLSEKKIQERQDIVEAFYYVPELRAHLKEELKNIKDIERLMMKVSTHFASPRDLLSLKNSLERIDVLKRLLMPLKSPAIYSLREKIPNVSPIADLLNEALVEEPPIRISEGNIFRERYHAELDNLRQITRGGKEWLVSYQTKMRQETGIKTLKVNFNKIFGYYIEVSKGQSGSMPSTFDRKQTLVNSERFISQELKEYEDKVLNAEEKIQALEQTLFYELREKIKAYEKEVLDASKAIAAIDVFYALASVAKKYGYMRPTVDHGTQFSIIEGRHPAVELVIGKENFIPNDTQFDESKTMMLITGPNMAGKSTYLRQVALITILAQIGSFVPAASAHIGIVDKIFSRIGANDDLSRGQSTFMVEMSETANILHNASARSLVILDEIGRGTSTYDGISIAWAVAEFLVHKKAKTLFATHYGELTELEKSFPAIDNFHAAVHESSGEIIFLHKIKNGSADRSYGIHVALLAGLPLAVVKRAHFLLNKLEGNQPSSKPAIKEKLENQLTLF